MLRRPGYPNEVVEGRLYIGNARHALCRDVLVRLRITHVVNASNDPKCLNAFAEGVHPEPLPVKYCNVPVADVEDAAISDYFDDVFEFVLEAFSGGNGKHFSGLVHSDFS